MGGWGVGGCGVAWGVARVAGCGNRGGFSPPRNPESRIRAFGFTGVHILCTGNSGEFRDN